MSDAIRLLERIETLEARMFHDEYPLVEGCWLHARMKLAPALIAPHDTGWAAPHSRGTQAPEEIRS